MFEAPKRRVEKVFIHCSASDMALRDNTLVNEITHWHLDRGFNDIGYHFVIDKLGTLLTGRSLEKIPAAQKGHNTGSIAICVHGYASFTVTSRHRLRAFCAEINEAYFGRITFHGHCEVSPKACPIFNYRKLLSLDQWGRMPANLE